MVAVGRGDVPPAAPWLQIMLTHEVADLLVVHHHAPLPERGPDPAPAIGLEFVADRGHDLDQGGVADLAPRCVVVGGARDPHQLASPRDREAGGPATADVVPFLGGAPERTAPFRNSSSSACLPTSRSRAAIRAS